MLIKFAKKSASARAPKYSTEGSGCFDLFASEVKDIEANQQELVGTGIAVEVPEGYVMLMFSRSGHAKNSRVSLGNSVGVIDSDYRGEVGVLLKNDSAENFYVYPGDKIAQAMILPVEQCEFVEGELSETRRGRRGFGSTGR